MWLYLIGYTVIFLIVAIVVFIELVAHKVIFKNSPKVYAKFARPLVLYSIKRIGSAFLSILLAITATYLLIRFKSKGELICKQAISTWDKLSNEIRTLKCNAVKENLGVSGNWFHQLITYFYKILPFPKTVCHTNIEDVITEAGTTYRSVNTDCRNFIMDLGTVYFIAGNKNQFVIDVIFKRMGVSFKVTILATIFQIVAGYLFGILMAKNKDGIFDKIGNAYINIVDAIPAVAYYYLLISIFMAVKIPTIVHVDNPATFVGPILAMVLGGMTGTGYMVRRFMVDEQNGDYVKFARAKGLKENRIVFIHILRNAVVFLVRSIPSAFLGSFLGAFYVEKIFGYSADGFGGLLITANDVGDFYVLQGIIVITALISVVSYLAGDIITAVFDPRVSFSKE